MGHGIAPALSAGIAKARDLARNGHATLGSGQPTWKPRSEIAPDLGFHGERATGIEPAPSVWKTEALPLSYARVRARRCPSLRRLRGA